MKLKLVVKNENERLVRDYLEKNVDERLAEKINTGKKTLADFFKYAQERARKVKVGSCACIRDIEVFGWAMHYFDEDGIQEEEKTKLAIKETTIARKSKKGNNPCDQINFFDLMEV